MKTCIVCNKNSFDDEKESCLNCGSGMNLWSEEQ